MRPECKVQNSSPEFMCRIQVQSSSLSSSPAVGTAAQASNLGVVGPVDEATDLLGECSPDVCARVGDEDQLESLALCRLKAHAPPPLECLFKVRPAKRVACATRGWQRAGRCWREVLVCHMRHDTKGLL